MFLRLIIKAFPFLVIVLYSKYIFTLTEFRYQLIFNQSNIPIQLRPQNF